MNKFRYTFIFLILISLFPCYEILANEETNNVPLQEITKNTEKKNTTKNVTEITNTSTTENKSNENAVNIETQQKKISFKMIVSWTCFLAIVIGISILIGGLGYGGVYLISDNLHKYKGLDIHINYYTQETLEVLCWCLVGGIYFVLSIVIKVFSKKNFFWSTVIPIFIVLAIILITTSTVLIILQIISQKKFNSRINKLSKRLLNTNLNSFSDICDKYCEYYNSLDKIEEEIKKKRKKYKKITPGWFNDGGKQECLDEINNLECDKEKLQQCLEQVRKNIRNFIDLNDIYFYRRNEEEIKLRIEKLQNEQIKSLEKQKQLAYEQIQNEATMQAKANEGIMKESEVKRNIEGLGDYIDMLGKAIQKKELPDVQVVSELSKILDLIFNNKSYIAKEDFNKIRNDNEVFVKHVLKKCHKIKNFSGSLLETRMKQVKEKFTKILK